MSSHDDHKSSTEGAIEKSTSTNVEHLEKSHGTVVEFDDSIEDTKPSKSVWLITFTVAMGGFLFGYDTGVISAVLVTIGDDLGHNLDSHEQELITSITSGGALIGALMAGLPADKYGRKLGIYIGCFLFLVGSVVQAAAFNVAAMTAGRLIVGFGVGSAAMIIPLYIGELAPAKYRGRMIAFDNLSVTLGQLVSYGLGAALTDVPHGWRYMIAIGGVPPIILAAQLPRCPESPRQVIAHGKRDEAEQCLRRVYPAATEDQLKSKLERIIWTVEVESSVVANKSLWWQFKQLHCVPSNLRALISACTVMAISQLGGFNTLMYYSATLFPLVGFNKPTAVAIVVDLVLQADSVNWAGIVVLVTIIFYVAFFATGVATIGWVGTELLPLEVRALGTMMNTVTCWSCNLIIASTFLSMMKSITPSGAFGFYAGICFFGWIFVIFFYPEVKGLPLEDVRKVFENGFDVKLAKQIQRDLKANSQAVVASKA
ncbi:ITR1-inositol permease [Fusarium coicis]|nr:ITR1-inositol permease [Fusarium coicis]